MSELQPKSPSRREILENAYASERARLSALAAADAREGDYAHPVFGEGNAEDAAVLFVGEAPGGEEAASGRPFVGKAGRQLDALLALSGIAREAIYITNVVKYRPVTRSERSVRNRTPGSREIAAALPLLRLEIAVLRPQCIVTLGNTPLSALLTIGGADGKQTVGALHGRAMALTADERLATLFPLYHPASGIYNRALVPVMEQDIRALGEHLVKAK